MDLTILDVGAAAEKGAVLTLKHPFTGEPLDARVHVLGRDARAVRAAMQDLDRRATAGERLSEEQRSVELLCVVITGWEKIEFDGAPLDFSPENVRKLVTDQRTSWIGEQVAPFVLSRRNFVGNLPTG